MRYLLVIIAVMSMNEVVAQTPKIIGLNFNSFGAVKHFRDNITRNPLGVSINFFWAPEDKKFQYGLEYGIAMYSAKEYDYELVAEGRPGTFIPVYEEDCFMKYHLVGRYLPFDYKAITTYIEARVGLTTFFSSRTAQTETDLYDDSFDFHGTAFNTALGLGALLDIGQIIKKEAWSTPFYLDIGATFNSGSRSDYRNMNEGEIASSLEHGNYRSVTHTTNYKVGLALGFN